MQARMDIEALTYFPPTPQPVLSIDPSSSSPSTPRRSIQSSEFTSPKLDTSRKRSFSQTLTYPADQPMSKRWNIPGEPLTNASSSSSSWRPAETDLAVYTDQSPVKLAGNHEASTMTLPYHSVERAPATQLNFEDDGCDQISQSSTTTAVHTAAADGP